MLTFGKSHIPYVMKSTLLFIAATALFGQVSAQQALTEEILWKINRVGEFRVSPDGKQVAYKVSTPDVKANKSTHNVWLKPVSGGDPKLLIDPSYAAFELHFTPDGKKLGFLSAKDGSAQLYEADLDKFTIARISEIPDGINGFLYAPDQKYIAYLKDVKLDKTVKEIYPDLDKTDARIMDGLFYRHWDSWHDYAYSHIFIAPYTNGSIGSATDIMEGERFDAPVQPFGGTEQLAWSTDSRKLVYTSRKQNGTAEAVSTNSDLYLFDLVSGETTNITANNLGYDNDPSFSPHGKLLAWQSMARPGYEADKNRIMVMDMGTKSVVEVTAKLDQTVEGFTWSRDGQKLYFIPVVQATKQLYEYDFKSGAIRAITSGDHDYLGVFAAVNGKKETLLAARQSMSSPTELYLVDPAKAETTTFTTDAHRVLSAVDWGRVEKRMVKATDGKEILTWIIYPPNMDLSRKYPTLLYCQGGPQSPVSQFFSYRWNFQLMAAKGYIVVAPNRRGLPGFGQAWTDEIGGDYGGQCMRDYLSAIDDATTIPGVDKERLGAVGASFGGYSVYWLAGNHNKRFKTFIAHCGMFNMESWYGTTEEMYFANYDQKGSYWDNPQNYQQFSPHRFVKNWDTPILIIHNEKDFRVPLGQGMEAFTAAQLRGVPSRFPVFPR